MVTQDMQREAGGAAPGRANLIAIMGDTKMKDANLESRVNEDGWLGAHSTPSGQQLRAFSGDRG